MRAEQVAPIAEVTRSGVVESIHHGALIALDGDGETVLAVGDPDVEIYPRSALKPLQTAAMLACGLNLAPPGVAIASASHAGAPIHTDAVLAVVASAGLTADDLGNTPTLPLDEATALAIRCGGGGPSALAQNCSGKHAAMFATCVANGWPLEGYLAMDHPLQQAIVGHIDRVTGGVTHVGVDGCGAPTMVVSLRGLAVAMAALAHEQGQVYRAMVEYPELVAGEGREDTVLMRAVPGLVVKGGAEAVGVAAHPDGRVVALKIADGSDRAREGVLLAALDRLGFDVAGVPRRPVLGHGRPVGEVRPLLDG